MYRLLGNMVKFNPVIAEGYVWQGLSTLGIKSLYIGRLEYSPWITLSTLLSSANFG